VERKIPSWVPILIILIFLGLVFVVARLGVRGYVVWQINNAGESWDDEGIVLQVDRWACVPCSFAMFLKEEGVEEPIAKMAWIAATDLDGTSSEGLERLAGYYGYTIREERMGFRGLMDEGLPAIVFYEDNGILHAVYVRPDSQERRLVVKNSVLGLTYVYENGVMEYFGSNDWDVFLME